MVSKLEELKKKKAMLLKKEGLKSANLESLKQRAAEEKKLKAEIFALEHPESSKAKDAFKSASKSFGSFIARNATLVARNAVRLEKERKERARKDKIEERKLEMVRLKATRLRGSNKKNPGKKTQKRKQVDYGW